MANILGIPSTVWCGCFEISDSEVLETQNQPPHMKFHQLKNTRTKHYEKKTPPPPKQKPAVFPKCPLSCWFFVGFFRWIPLPRCLVENLLSEELLELRVKPTFNDPNNPKAFFHSVASYLASTVVGRLGGGWPATCCVFVGRVEIREIFGDIPTFLGGNTWKYT